MARSRVLLLTILVAGVFAASTAQARFGWTLAESVNMYGPYKTAMEDVPGYLPGTVYGFLDKTADANHPQLDYVVEGFLDGKVGLLTYANSDHTVLKAEAVQAALILNGPDADWSVKEEYLIGKVDGEIKYLGELREKATMLIIGTGKYFDAVNAAKDARATTPTAPNPAAVPTPVESVPTNVVSAITKNRWTADSLIVSGTLTNASAVAVLITGVDARGFDEHQKMVARGSDYTIVHNDLAPGEIVNFKVALKDDGKQVRSVELIPSWTH